MRADELHLTRRNVLAKGGAAAAFSLAGPWSDVLRAQDRVPTIDYAIKIGPMSLELAPGKIVKTTGYNGTGSRPGFAVARRQAGRHQCHQ